MATKAAFRDKLKEATETGRAQILKFEEEAQKLVQKVVSKGRDAQAEGKKRFEELFEKAAVVGKVRETDLVRRVQAIRQEVEERLEGGMEKVLDAFGVATREQVQEIGKRLDALDGRVSELFKRAKREAKARMQKATAPRKK